MAVHVIKKGLDLPITGEPEQKVSDAAAPGKVALMAADYVGMRPTFFVQVGEPVKRGQVVFEDKKNPGVLFTAPGAGTLSAVNRGAKRALQSVVIDLNENERQGRPADADHAAFEQYTGKSPVELDDAPVEALLIESGLWTALRTRPYSKVPAPQSRPHAIFVTAMDTHPHAPDLAVIAEGRDADMLAGLQALKKLCGTVYFCKAPGAKVGPPEGAGVTVEEFQGPHPSGLPGTHIHLLDPVSRHKTVWHVGLQDVLAMGVLFNTGKLDVARVVSLAGPPVKQPRLLRTRLGAALDEVLGDELEDGEVRVISGSVLSGRAGRGEIHGYLGRYDQQVSVLAEDREQEFLGWMMPGKEKFSITNLFLSRLSPGKKFAMTTTRNGSPRAMVPIGLYEAVMPLDIIPTFLLRSLYVQDIERAEELGCLELDEEDLALCTYVAPGKVEWGPLLRENLAIIEKEG